MLPREGVVFCWVRCGPSKRGPDCQTAASFLGSATTAHIRRLLVEKIHASVVSATEELSAYQGENEKGEVTDVFSFYSLPSSILGIGLSCLLESAGAMTPCSNRPSRIILKQCCQGEAV